jgi:anaerobic ribonucleoside-triphosphate reductase activating protein
VERVAVFDTVEGVLATPEIDGVTLTGGEPLEQPDAVARFATSLRESSDLSIVALTGYTRQEIMGNPKMLRAAMVCDVLVCGRYNEQQRVARGLRGSFNKEYWFLTDRYSQADFDRVPEAEFVIHRDGTVTATGVDPILLGGMS